MTVKGLLGVLEGLDPSMEVFCYYDEFGIYSPADGAWVVTLCRTPEKGQDDTQHIAPEQYDRVVEREREDDPDYNPGPPQPRQALLFGSVWSLPSADMARLIAERQQAASDNP
jgi:hypothetical protein